MDENRSTTCQMHYHGNQIQNLERCESFDFVLGVLHQSPAPDSKTGSADRRFGVDRRSNTHTHWVQTFAQSDQLA